MISSFSVLEQVDNFTADLALPFLIFIKFNFRLALASGLAGPRFGRILYGSGSGCFQPGLVPLQVF